MASSIFSMSFLLLPLPHSSCPCPWGFKAAQGLHLASSILSMCHSGDFPCHEVHALALPKLEVQARRNSGNGFLLPGQNLHLPPSDTQKEKDIWRLGGGVYCCFQVTNQLQDFHGMTIPEYSDLGAERVGQ